MTFPFSFDQQKEHAFNRTILPNMFFLVANSTMYFFPILLINFKSNLDLLGVFLTLVEFGGSVIGIVWTVQICSIVCNTRVFHVNMNRCICFFSLHWFEIFIGRAMILPYQKGWIVIPGNDPSVMFHEFYSKNASDVPQINSFWDCPCLAIGMFLFSHYLHIVILFILGITIERTCATFFINDYEGKKRPEICWTIMIFLEIASLFFSFLMFTQLLNSQNGFYLIVIYILISFGCLLYIWFKNVRAHHFLDASLIIPSKYTLRARFQAKENMKSLSLLKFVMTIILESTFLFCQFFKLLGVFEIPILYLLELGNTSNPVFTVPMLVLSVPTWKRLFLKQYAFVPGVRKIILKQGKVTMVQKTRTSSRKETEQYFSQLRKAWG